MYKRQEYVVRLYCLQEGDGCVKTSIPCATPIPLSMTPPRTTVVEDNLSPEWDETFEFAVKDFTRRLDVEVLDSDVMVDESMGRFTLRLEDLLHKRRVRFM